MTIPLVSAIIPTYKRSDTLLRTINSVLEQTYPNTEIIVVDDNGEGTEFQLTTEKSLKDYIEKGIITYIKHPINKNGSAARNTGFKACHGDYVKFLDDDDFLLKKCIEKQVGKLHGTDKDIGAIYCNMQYRIKKKLAGQIIYKNSKCELSGFICKEYLLGINSFNTSAILFKREVIEKLHGFDESFYRHQDYELMVRFFRYFKIICTSTEPLTIYNLTTNRINIPSPPKDYQIKQKFLSAFRQDFEKWNFWGDVFKKFWLDAILNSVASLDYTYFKKSLTEYHKEANLDFYEKVKILKTFIKSVLLRLKYES